MFKIITNFYVRIFSGFRLAGIRNCKGVLSTTCSSLLHIMLDIYIHLKIQNLPPLSFAILTLKYFLFPQFQANYNGKIQCFFERASNLLIIHFFLP